MRRLRGERGSALLEMAMTLPLLLLVSVGIFEFGHAYQTWQVLTNAAREAARVSILPGTLPDTARNVARTYMANGYLSDVCNPKVGCDAIPVTVNRGASITVNGVSVSASQVTIQFPFTFAAVAPVAQLVQRGSKMPGSITITATAVMRNEQ